jgi:hypothetical protein
MLNVDVEDECATSIENGDGAAIDDSSRLPSVRRPVGRSAGRDGPSCGGAPYSMSQPWRTLVSCLNRSTKIGIPPLSSARGSLDDAL